MGQDQGKGQGSSAEDAEGYALSAGLIIGRFLSALLVGFWGNAGQSKDEESALLTGDGGFSGNPSS